MGSDRRDCRKIWHPLRWPVELDAMLREQGVCTLPVKIVDISMTGCRIATGYRTRVGAWARLSIDGFVSFKATIVASDLHHAKLQFDQPLYPSVMRHIVALGLPQRKVS